MFRHLTIVTSTCCGSVMTQGIEVRIFRQSLREATCHEGTTVHWRKHESSILSRFWTCAATTLVEMAQMLDIVVCEARNRHVNVCRDSRQVSGIHSVESQMLHMGLVGVVPQCCGRRSNIDCSGHGLRCNVTPQ